MAPINHPHYQTANSGPHQQQTTSILINSSNGQPMPPFYVMNSQAPPPQQQAAGATNAGPSKVKKAVVSVNEGNATSTSSSQHRTTNNSNNYTHQGPANQVYHGYGPVPPNQSLLPSGHPSQQQHFAYPSGPTMSTSSTSSQLSQYSYAGPYPGQPNIRMLIPGVQPQFYPPPQQQLNDHQNPVYYPYNSQQLQHQHSNPGPQYGGPQQQPPQPPPSSTPSNAAIHSNQSAPHTPSPMPSQQNVFLPASTGQREHASGSNPQQPQGLIYQPQGPPPPHSYYMQPNYPPQGYMPPSPAGSAPQPYQAYNVPNTGYRKFPGFYPTCCF
jgi:hypothetical protein